VDGGLEVGSREDLEGVGDVDGWRREGRKEREWSENAKRVAAWLNVPELTDGAFERLHEVPGAVMSEDLTKRGGGRWRDQFVEMLGNKREKEKCTNSPRTGCLKRRVTEPRSLQFKKTESEREKISKSLKT